MIMDAQRIVGRAVLAYWIMNKLTCEKSGRPLDKRNAVAFEINYVSGRASAVVVHSDHADEIAGRMDDVRAHPLVSAVTVYDGRQLYSRRRKAVVKP